MPTFNSSDRSSQVDWFVRRGTDASLLLTFTQGGAVYDTSTLVITTTVKTVGGLVVATPSIVNGGVTGLVTLSLNNTQTDLVENEYFWSVKLQTAALYDMMMINGKFVINDFLWDSENSFTDSTLQILI